MCRFVAHECGNHPCQEGGTCHYVTSSSYRCDCILGRAGDNCQFRKYNTSRFMSTAVFGDVSSMSRPVLGVAPPICDVMVRRLCPAYMGIYMGMWLFARTSGARVGGFPGGLAELNRSNDVGRRSERYRRPKLAGRHRSVYDTHLVLTLCGLTSQKLTREA